MSFKKAQQILIAAWLAMLLLMIVLPANAEVLRIAVAANFLQPLTWLKPVFEAEYGHQLVVISGSSGKLYAQLVQGAPFDVFLSADSDKPSKLAGKHLAEKPFDYALGRLTLVVQSQQVTCEKGLLDEQAATQWLRTAKGKRISVANPAVAPYGLAGQAVLQHLTPALAVTLVTAENVSQVAHYVKTRSVEAGFMAASLLPLLAGDECVWHVPANLHPPIMQKGAVLSRIKKHPVKYQAALALQQFLTGAQTQQALLPLGYHAINRELLNHVP